MRYEGSITITGTLSVVIDEPGLTLAQAKSKIQANPEKYKRLFVENIDFEDWDEELELIEGDEEE